MKYAPRWEPTMTSLGVLDTETTGLTLHPSAPIVRQPRLVEVSLARVSRKNGKLLSRDEWLINPGIPIPPDATAIHKLTDEDVKDAPRFTEAWPKIQAAFEQCDMLLAHNAPFDRDMIQLELQRAIIKWDMPFMCTIGLFREQFGYDMKLTQLYEYATGKKLAQRHRAGSDVDALVDIVQALELWK